MKKGIEKKSLPVLLSFLLIFLGGCGLFGQIEREMFSLEIEVVGQGDVNVLSEDQPQNNNKFRSGTSLKLEAIPEGDSFFSHWERDLQVAKNPVDLTMDSDKMVRALFLEFGQDWRYLYAGDHRIEMVNAIGFDVEGKWEAAVIISPVVDDKNITRISFYDFDEGATIKAKIYGAEGTDHPGDELLISSEEYETNGRGWTEFLLSDKIPISGYDYYWIVLEVDDPGEGFFPLGVADGPEVIGRNKIKNGDEGVWKNLSEEDAKFDFNWLINILVEF